MVNFTQQLLSEIDLLNIIKGQIELATPNQSVWREVKINIPVNINRKQFVKTMERFFIAEGYNIMKEHPSEPWKLNSSWYFKPNPSVKATLIKDESGNE